MLLLCPWFLFRVSLHGWFWVPFGTDARVCNSCSMLVISVFLFSISSHSFASSLDLLSEIQDRPGSRKKGSFPWYRLENMLLYFGDRVMLDRDTRKVQWKLIDWLHAVFGPNMGCCLPKRVWSTQPEVWRLKYWASKCLLVILGFWPEPVFINPTTSVGRRWRHASVFLRLSVSKQSFGQSYKIFQPPLMSFSHFLWHAFKPRTDERLSFAPHLP